MEDQSRDLKKIDDQKETRFSNNLFIPTNLWLLWMTRCKLLVNKALENSTSIDLLLKIHLINYFMGLCVNVGSINKIF
jgi:hypothetical protein